MALVSNATFGVVLFSCDLGMAKPDSAIYLTATDQLGADPADCLYAGTGAGDELAGEPQPGLTTLRIIELNNTNPNWQGTHSPRSATCRPCSARICKPLGVRVPSGTLHDQGRGQRKRGSRP
ncbi:hypothetical protein MCAG_05100 [Micromonospora sp. ATCC 39149]|uniref:Uncharacterized protein n=1 Tax=Micromonospora carbonacea TaxID=47853 RepID=A0A7D6C7W6_9ACTN|nr:hypothetical protein [Micromonospora sp. ATCC 39149]EEP74773.1 hypothetical protein MCAG_05100 [Micromonospora sp. ATCC 39149]QLK00565.1 hypothetical protein HZU44_11395 [Micromonospora carbonacea]